jgi:hypothetical protein
VYMGPKYEKFIYQAVILCFTKNAELIFYIMELFDLKCVLIIVLKKMKLTQPFYG